jgi:hypothetical protein
VFLAKIINLLILILEIENFQFDERVNFFEFQLIYVYLFLLNQSSISSDTATGRLKSPETIFPKSKMKLAKRNPE